MINGLMAHFSGAGRLSTLLSRKNVTATDHMLHSVVSIIGGLQFNAMAIQYARLPTQQHYSHHIQPMFMYKIIIKLIIEQIIHLHLCFWQFDHALAKKISIRGYHSLTTF